MCKLKLLLLEKYMQHQSSNIKDGKYYQVFAWLLSALQLVLTK